jgi:hypothetical protein
MADLPGVFVEEVAAALAACTEEELRLERLPEFNPAKHGIIAELPMWLKKHYAVIVRLVLALRHKTTPPGGRTKAELLLSTMQDIFLIEIQRLYAGDIRNSAVSVCRGGLLVNAKGERVTLTA